MDFGSNLQLLRKRQHLSQQDVARELNVSRSSLSTYELGTVEPPYSTLLKLAKFYRLSVDVLLREDLSKWSEQKISAWQQEADIAGQKLRVLTTTVGSDNEENIELVDTKAKAGYTTGFADPEYIASLPTFRLPFLNGQRKYRAFSITGDSMPPVPDGSIVIGEFVQDWNAISDGQECIVLTLDEGIVFKKVFIEPQGLLLVSTNPTYELYLVPFNEVREVWQFTHYISDALESDFGSDGVWTQAIRNLQREVAEIKANQNGLLT